jgi:hypothetical protein
MRNSLKIAALAVVLFMALGAVALLYAGMQNGFVLADTQQANTQDLRTLLNSNNITLPDDVTWPCHMGYGRQMMGGGFEFVQSLSDNSTLSTVQGTVVAQSRDILILDTGSGQVRVMVPNAWTVGSEVVSGAELFNGTFVSSGQTLTVNVLENELFSNANFSVNVMLGYEAINATGTHAYAALPFNIQPAG